MQQVKQLDFTGETIFCGIDVHKTSWKVSVRNEQIELKTFSQTPSPVILANYLKEKYPLANYKAVYEAGFCGFGYQRAFAELGVDCIVVHAADVPTTDKEKNQKTDAIDCRKLSRSLCEGSLKGINIPTVQQQDDRFIIRNYKQFIKDVTVCKNRIKGWLHFQGIYAPADLRSSERHWSGNYIKWLKELPLTTQTARMSLDLLIHSLENSRAHLLLAIRAIRKLAGQEPYKAQMELIQSVPGVGQITALMFLTEIGDINRFQKFDQLCAYIGLIPTMHTSNDKGYVGEMTYRGHQQMRSTLMECSWRAVRDDAALTLAFAKYCQVMKKNKAIVKIARKLLSRIRYVLKNQKPYEYNIAA